MAEVRIARTAFVTEVEGTMITVRKGLIVDAAHPVLKGREDLFARPEDCIELAVAPKKQKKAKDPASE